MEERPISLTKWPVKMRKDKMIAMNFYDKKHLARLLSIGVSSLEIILSHERLESLVERSGRNKGVFEDNIIQFFELVKIKCPAHKNNAERALNTIQQRKRVQRIIEE